MISLDNISWHPHCDPRVDRPELDRVLTHVGGIRGRPAATIGLASFRIGPKDHFFDILKPQTHVSLVKCTQP